MKKKIIVAIIIGLISGGTWFALSPNNTKSLHKKSEVAYNTCDYYNDIIKIAEKMGDNINNIKELVLLYKEYDRLTKLMYDITHTEICGNYDDFLEAHTIIKYVSDLHFKVDKTLTQTVYDKTVDNEARYLDFQVRAENNPQKIGKWNDMAQELKIKTIDVDNLIDSIRYELRKAGANKNSPKIIMLDDNDGKPGAGFRLKSTLTSYREYLLSLDLYPLTDTTIRTEIKKMLSTDDVSKDATTQSWEEHQYGGHQLVVVLAFLNQTKLDVANAEDMVLELLEQKTGK